MRCPECKSENTSRSHRRGLKEAIGYRLLRRVIYKCSDCGKRYGGVKRSGNKRRNRQARLNRYLLIAAIVLSAIVAVSIVEFSNRSRGGGAALDSGEP